MTTVPGQDKLDELQRFGLTQAERDAANLHLSHTPAPDTRTEDEAFDDAQDAKVEAQMDAADEAALEDDDDDDVYDDDDFEDEDEEDDDED